MSRLPALLLAGRAVRLWAGAIERQAARLRGLPQSAAWVAAFDAPVWRHLSDKPLLGRTLAALVGEEGAAASTAPAEARPARLTAARPHGKLPRGPQPGLAGSSANRRDDPTPRAGGPPGARRPAADLAALPRQAEPSLLRRLAGAVLDDTAPRARSAARGGKKAGAAPPAADERSASRRAALAHRSVEASRPAGERCLEVGERRAAELRSLATLLARASAALRWAGAESLARQWSAALAGPQAPRELLEELVGRPEHISRVASRPRGSSPAAPEQHRAARTIADPAGYPEPYTPAGSDATAPADARSALETLGVRQVGQAPAAEALPPGAPLVAGADALIRSVSANGEAPAPAGLGLPLPALLPPQEPGVPPLPVAATMAGQGALLEALHADDDLDVLAAKIKRILDDEARRHGIDV